MQRFARIENGLVAEIMFSPDGADFAELFHPEIAAACRPCGPEVAQGWVLDGDDLVAPPPTVPTQDQLLTHAADQRWRREVGGITVAGVPVATDDRSKLMIAGARLAAMADPQWTTPWHGSDGGIYPLDAAAIVVISDAVSGHVQESFAIFAGVKTDIEAGTIASFAEIDAAFS